MVFRTTTEEYAKHTALIGLTLAIAIARKVPYYSDVS